MSVHRYQSSWRSIIFNRRYDDTGLVDDPAHLVSAYLESDYYLTACDITRVSEQDYRELRQFLEGAEPNEAFEGMRVINGEGSIVAATVADLEDKTWAMHEAFSVAACRMAFASNDPPGVGPFDFKRASGGGTLSLRLYARPGIGRPLILARAREGLTRPFSFQLIAYDPFVYSQSLRAQSLAVGSNTVNNAGNIYTKPKFTFGQAASGVLCTIANSTTGQSFQVQVPTLTGSDTLTLDVARGTIVLINGANPAPGIYKYDARAAGFLSQMFLNPGNNTIVITGAVSTGLGISYRDAYA